jgi:hypothetical protein
MPAVYPAARTRVRVSMAGYAASLRGLPRGSCARSGRCFERPAVRAGLRSSDRPRDPTIVSERGHRRAARRGRTPSPRSAVFLPGPLRPPSAVRRVSVLRRTPGGRGPPGPRVSVLRRTRGCRGPPQAAGRCGAARDDLHGPPAAGSGCLPRAVRSRRSGEHCRSGLGFMG